MNLTNIQTKLYSNKWAMEKKSLYSFYNIIEGLVNLRAGGLYGRLFGNPIPLVKNELVTDNINESESSHHQQEGNITIININGILSKGVSLEEQTMLGMVNTDDISNALDVAADDPSVDIICLCFASPGGETTGIVELGRKIKNIDTNIKPIVAWTETQMTSAAAWLGSQTRFIGMTESANIAGCGVYMIILDETGKLEKEGIKVQAISSGKYKMLGHTFNPLSTGEKELLQKDVNEQHQTFKDVVKSNRPNIKDESLEGLSYEGPEAMENGWADYVCDSFEEFIQEKVVSETHINK